MGDHKQSKDGASVANSPEDNVDSPQGVQAIDILKPENIYELAAGNSALRLMASEEHPELPLVTFAKHKENPRLWDMQLEKYKVSAIDREKLLPMLGTTYGVCIEQEQIMRISMVDSVFSMKDANMLRKAIARKNPLVLAEAKEKWFKQGKEEGKSDGYLNYCWTEAFMLSAGYGFSQHHSISYSTIAIQEMNLAYRYPTLFWNTARLLVESDSTENLELTFLEDEEDEEATAQKNSVNYFKLASAIGSTRRQGIAIEKPNINKSGFVFTPSVEENKIYFGLSGIAGVGAPLVEEILQKRPFNSPQEVLEKTSLNRLQVANLVKAGCFDEVEPNREQLLDSYCRSIADTKKNLNMRNMPLLVKLNVFPEKYKPLVDLWKIKTFLSKYCKHGDFYIPQADMWQHIENYDIEPLVDEESGAAYFTKKDFDKYTTAKLEPIKQYIKDNKEKLLSVVNLAAEEEMVGKYFQTLEAGELHALSYYYTQSIFQTPLYANFAVKTHSKIDFTHLNEEPIIEWQNDEGAKKFELTRIAVSVVGRDRQKCIVGCIDHNNNFFLAKINKNTFKKFDKQITTETGREKSWFSKGSQLLLTGYRNGDLFQVKSYKGSTAPIAKIKESSNTLILEYERED